MSKRCRWMLTPLGEHWTVWNMLYVDRINQSAVAMEYMPASWYVVRSERCMSQPTAQYAYAEAAAITVWPGDV